MTVRAWRAVFGLVFAVAGLSQVVFVRSVCPGVVTLPVVVLLASGIVGFGAWFAFCGPDDVTKLTPLPRSTPRSRAPALPSHPYRGTAPDQAVTTHDRTRRISARKTALAVIGAMLATASIVHVTLETSLWLEVECVLAVWWLVWTVVITLALRRPGQIVDDHSFSLWLPWSRAALSPERPASRRPARAPTSAPASIGRASSSSWRIGPLDVLSGIGDLDGVVVAVLLVVLVVAALAAAFLMIELVALVFFVGYVGVLSAMRWGEQRRGTTTGAAAVGAAWATVYFVPLAAAVGLAHVAFGG